MKEKLYYKASTDTFWSYVMAYLAAWLSRRANVMRNKRIRAKRSYKSPDRWDSGPEARARQKKRDDAFFAACGLNPDCSRMEDEDDV